MGAETRKDRRQAPGKRTTDNCATSPAKLDRAARIVKATELRLQGKSYDAIAQAMGIHRSYAFKLVDAGMEMSITRAADELRVREGDRLDELIALLADRVDAKKEIDSNTLGAIDRLIRISESRRKLFGLDAPERLAADFNLNPATDKREGLDQAMLRLWEANKVNADHGSN